MLLTVFVVIVLAAFVVTVASAATPKVPLWVAVLLLCVVELLRTLPLGK